MAIRNKEELLSILNTHFGDSTDDNVLSILEDVSDTIGDYETKTNGGEDWKSKYEENDNMWRTKYKERFMTTPKEGEPSSSEGDEPEDNEKKTFESLFE